MRDILVEVKRDSVCMGDDVDAPHFLRFKVADNVLLNEIFTQLASRKYLAKVAGENHYWEAIIDNEVVATVRGNNQIPETSDYLKRPVSNFVQRHCVQLHYKYYSAKN